MNEQTSIPPSTLEWVAEHRGFQIYRASDGCFEAYRTTASCVTHVGIARSGEEKEFRVGTRSERIILPCADLDAAIAMLDERTKRKPSEKIIKINKDQIKMNFDHDQEP